MSAVFIKFVEFINVNKSLFNHYPSAVKKKVFSFTYGKAIIIFIESIFVDFFFSHLDIMVRIYRSFSSEYCLLQIH